MQETKFYRARVSKVTPLLNMTTPIPVRRPTKQEESMTVEFPPPLLSEAKSSSSSSSFSSSSRFRVWERAKRTEFLALVLCPSLEVDVEEETNSKVVLNRSKEEGERSDCEGLEWKKS